MSDLLLYSQFLVYLTYIIYLIIYAGPLFRILECNELHSTQDRQYFTYAISNLTSDIWERPQAFAVQCPHTVILLRLN